MGMFNRMSGYNDNGTSLDVATHGAKLPVHQFGAGLREVGRGKVLVTLFESFFILAGTDLDGIKAKFATLTPIQKDQFGHSIEDWGMLGEKKTPGYETQADFDALVSTFVGF